MRKPCCEKNESTAVNKGAWSKQEDQKLIDYIHDHGEGCWRSLPKAAGLQRCGKSCRLRWVNYLRPDLKRGCFGEDEEDLIIKLHALLGNRWSLIAGRLPGRTDNEVKNYWNTHLKKKLERMGINPNNHRLASPHNYTILGRHCCNKKLSPRTSNNEDSSSVSRATIEPAESNATSTVIIPDLNLDLSIAPPLMVQDS